MAGSPLRVLLVGALYNNHLRRWAINAGALGHRVYAAGHVWPGRRPADFSGVAEHVELAPEEHLGPGGVRDAAWLRKLIERLEPDIVHAHFVHKWGYAAARSGHPRVAITGWGSDVYVAPDRPRGDWALRHAGWVLARSDHMRRAMIARGAPAERIHLIDLGVDLDRFRPASDAERARLRGELDLPSGPIILSFRAGTALYNLDVVLAAFRRLRERVPEATLVFIHGDAPLARPVRAALHELNGDGRVRLLGQVAHADMPKYLRAASAGISIPNTDGSPSSVWEALACGLPLVLSDLPQIEERVGGSEAALLVEPEPEAVASALHAIVADPQERERMSSGGRTWALANADEREQIARLERLYAAMAS
jgi:glycosyltransferase involved in cell wall biosynthesis